MKLYSYVVRNDLGLAPNPFWGYCTLAVCTPNHMGVKAEKDDWIIGTSPVSQGSKLVYAMQIFERLSFEAYYADERFVKKNPTSLALGVSSAAIICTTKTSKENGFNIPRFIT